MTCTFKHVLTDLLLNIFSESILQLKSNAESCHKSFLHYFWTASNCHLRSFLHYFWAAWSCHQSCLNQSWLLVFWASAVNKFDCIVSCHSVKIILLQNILSNLLTAATGSVSDQHSFIQVIAPIRSFLHCCIKLTSVFYRATDKV